MLMINHRADDDDDIINIKMSYIYILSESTGK